MIISPSYYTFSPSLFQTQKRIFPFSHIEKTFENHVFKGFPFYYLFIDFYILSMTFLIVILTLLGKKTDTCHSCQCSQ